MKITLAIIVIIIFAFQPAKSKDAHGTAQGKTTPYTGQTEKPYDNSDNSQRPPISVTINNAPTANNQSDEDHFKKNMDIQRRLVLFTGLLVVVGLATGFFVWLQAYETKKAANAAQSAAEAALKNAEAVIVSQRPWLSIYPKKTFHPQQFLDKENHRRFDFIVQNHGNTAAKITICGFRAQILKASGLESRLPSIPNYRLNIEMFNIPIAPQSEAEFWTDVESGEDRYSIADDITISDVENIESGVKELVAYGHIIYTDFFGSRQFYEARFCHYWAWKFDEFRPDLRAPAEYHQCT